MKPALFLSNGGSTTAIHKITSRPEALGRIVDHDIYSLPTIELDDYGALLIGMHADQRFLAGRAAQIERFLRGGGTAVANGHIAYPYLPGMAGFHTQPSGRREDLAIIRMAEHPVWHGVSAHDLTFRRGVAGFYGRVWHDAPERAYVINSVGSADKPLDFIYPVGRGRVLFHGGNDLWQFGGADSTSRIVPQLLQWLFDTAPASSEGTS